MFAYDDIKNFNRTEMAIYKYIMANLPQIPYMTIREIAAENHVSTTTFLRFCAKSGFSSYNEFKAKLKQMTGNIAKVPTTRNLDEIFLFFKGVSSASRIFTAKNEFHNFRRYRFIRYACPLWRSVFFQSRHIFCRIRRRTLSDREFHL